MLKPLKIGRIMRFQSADVRLKIKTTTPTFVVQQLVTGDWAIGVHYALRCCNFTVLKTCILTCRNNHAVEQSVISNRHSHVYWGKWGWKRWGCDLELIMQLSKEASQNLHLRYWTITAIRTIFVIIFMRCHYFPELLFCLALLKQWDASNLQSLGHSFSQRCIWWDAKVSNVFNHSRMIFFQLNIFWMFSGSWPEPK